MKEKSNRNQTKGSAVFNKKRKSKGFCKNVGRHVRGRYPMGRKSTVRNVFANKMVPNINMFRARTNGRVVGKCTSALVIGKKWKRVRNR